MADSGNSSTAIAKVEPATNEATGLALVIERLAANPQVDVAKLEKIIELQERILAHGAKAAFDAAFAAMQSELPVVAERGKTDKGKYATLEDIVEIVRPILARHHFSLSHRTEWGDAGRIRIVGMLAHSDGHEKQSEFLTIPDKSGSKNDVQSLGSAMAYGRRYTTLDLLNIVSRGEDDDGAKAARPMQPPQQKQTPGPLPRTPFTPPPVVTSTVVVPAETIAQDIAATAKAELEPVKRLTEAEATAPPKPSSLRVTAVLPKSGKRNGQSIIYWMVVFSTGKEAGTTDEKLAKLALDLMGQDAPVEYVAQPGKARGSFELVELRRVK
jgi:hypothetical protein